MKGIKKIFDEHANEWNHNKDKVMSFEDFCNAVLEVQKLERLKLSMIIANKQERIESSLKEYLSEGNTTFRNAEILKLMKENEVELCNELLKEIRG